MGRLSLFFSMGLIASFGAAPVAYAEPDQSWTGFFLSGPPDKDSKLLVWFDGHARFRDGAEEIDVATLVELSNRLVRLIGTACLNADAK